MDGWKICKFLASKYFVKLKNGDVDLKRSPDHQWLE